MAQPTLYMGGQPGARTGYCVGEGMRYWIASRLRQAVIGDPRSACSGDLRIEVEFESFKVVIPSLGTALGAVDGERNSVAAEALVLFAPDPDWKAPAPEALQT